MTRTMGLRLAISIQTMNIANTIPLKFADSPHALMSHILLQDERRAAAPASGSTMNSHKIEAPCCKKRTDSAGIKEGDLCLRGKYITATRGKDTKITKTGAAYLAYILAEIVLVESIAG